MIPFVSPSLPAGPQGELLTRPAEPSGTRRLRTPTSSVFVREHDREDACCFFESPGSSEPYCIDWSSISKLPKLCSLCGSSSGVKSSNVLVSSIARALTSFGRALTAAVIMTRPPVNDLRKRSLGVRILALLVPWIASCPSGSISASQVGHRSLQRQTHSSHQSVPQGQGTTASVSSSFRSVREGMGDFGIAFLPSGSDLEWFGHRLVRSF